ncbi:MAG: sulfite exporter TauE/SafE family protein [Bacteroidales bacterium]|jgi:uncharacterized membrane protein YfcA|nr:sulfite exporter TauE/SafE family protein [Bacteroidota bacterium]
MTAATIALIVAIGIVTGILSGMLGIGGAVIMIPAMVFLMGMDQRTAQGTSLWVLLPPISIFAAINYLKEGYVNMKFVVILVITFIIGSYFGSKIALSIPQESLRRIFGLLLLAIALKMLFSK